MRDKKNIDGHGNELNCSSALFFRHTALHRWGKKITAVTTTHLFLQASYQQQLISVCDHELLQHQVISF